MAKKKKEEAKKGLPEWQATYGDLVTLLMTFFIMMFAMSTIDTNKVKAFITSYTGTSGILNGGMSYENSGNLTGSGVSFLPDYQAVVAKASDGEKNIAKKTQEMKEIEENVSEDLKEAAKNNKALEGAIDVEKTDDFVKITFNNSVMFNSGEATLKSEATVALDAVFDTLKELETTNNIKIEGHTDNVPINTLQFPSNWHLSSDRALEVLIYYINKGIDKNAISASGYGEFSPVADNSTAEGKAKNRRVEIKIMSRYSN